MFTIGGFARFDEIAFAAPSWKVVRMDKVKLRRMIGASEPWFRAQRGDLGTKYSFIHINGVVAVLLIALIASATGLALFILLGRTSFGGGIGFTIGSIFFCALLLGVVHLTGDRPES